MLVFSDFDDLIMLKNPSQTAEDLINYCLSEGRICPKRKAWDLLNHLYLGTQPRALKIIRSERVPVLKAQSPFAEKFKKSFRLRIIISFADRHNQINLVDRLIRSLPKEEWHYFGDYRKLI